jgi:hypothetical protein
VVVEEEIAQLYQILVVVVVDMDQIGMVLQELLF